MVPIIILVAYLFYHAVEKQLMRIADYINRNLIRSG